MELNGTQRNLMESNRTQRNPMELNGTQRNGTKQNSMLFTIYVYWGIPTTNNDHSGHI